MRESSAWVACDLEVVTFVAAPGAYYFILSDSRRGDVLKVHTLQPSIEDHDYYASYLWVQALQGYFLMRQLFVEQRAQEWRVVAEFQSQPLESDFFERQAERWAEVLEGASEFGLPPRTEQREAPAP